MRPGASATSRTSRSRCGSCSRTSSGRAGPRGRRRPSPAGARRREPSREISLHAGAGADAGLHRRPRGGRPRRDARRDARPRRRSGEDQPAAPDRARHRPLDAGRRVREPRSRSSATPSSSSSATASATRSCAGDGRPSTTSPSSRRRRASSTRSTSSTWPASSSCARWTDGPGVPGHGRRHRLAHDDGQRARRARLGRRRDRGRGGDARRGDLDARAAGRRLQALRRAARGRDRDRPRPDRDADPALDGRRREVRRVLRRRASRR